MYKCQIVKIKFASTRYRKFNYISLVNVYLYATYFPLDNKSEIESYISNLYKIHRVD